MAYGFNSCKSDLRVTHTTTLRLRSACKIYVDDILLTGSDEAGIFVIKAFLQIYLVMHDLQILGNFLEIEFAY